METKSNWCWLGDEAHNTGLSLIESEWFHLAAEMWEKAYIKQEKNQDIWWETAECISTDHWKGSLGVRETVIVE